VGCSLFQTSQKQDVAEVEIIDGCLVRIKGITAQTADHIIREWNINTNCEIDIKATAKED